MLVSILSLEEQIIMLFVSRLREAVHCARAHQRRGGQLNSGRDQEPRLLSQIRPTALHINWLKPVKPVKPDSFIKRACLSLFKL